MKRKNLFALFFCVISLKALAGPGNYYNSLDTNLACASFKTALFHLIASNTNVVPYASVDNYYNRTDEKPAETGGGYVIVERYASENPFGTDYCDFRYPAGFCLTTPSDTNECVCYNKEHVFPKSWFGTTVYPMYSDMHYVWPADNRVNLFKSNFPIGYQKNATYTSKNGTKIGQSDGSKNFGYTSSNIFEPIDSFKGDFARAYLYVVTRYEDSIPFWPGRSTSSNVLDGNKYPGLKSWILQICVNWSKMDPPSSFEMKRNDSVYAIQGNRNPYIDHPEWVEKIFGPNGISASCTATAVKTKSNAHFQLYPNPAQNILTIIFDNSISDDDAIFEVLDVSGRKIMSQKIDPGRMQQSIDVSSYANGTYFIDLIYKGENNVSTFIKK